MTLRLIPAKKNSIEIQVSNSRFIAAASPVFDVDEAKAFVNEIKTQYPDANHHVPAFIIGHGSSITEHCSDDGEPSGTAGRPALAVLKGSGFGDIAVVIVRYFGGTKLGKGGLVRAYGDAMRAVLADLPRAQKVATETLQLVVGYAQFEQTKLLIASQRGLIEAEEFGAEVSLTVRFRATDVAEFQAGIQELTNGQVVAEVIGQDENTIMPLD